MLWQQLVSGGLFLLAAGLFLYILRLKRAMEEIRRDFAARLAEDTNALIGVSCRDKSVCRLAAALNEQLIVLQSQRHRYERGDAELKEALTNISHDLRTPLTALGGYLELLRRQLSPASKPVGHLTAQEAGQTARYLACMEERLGAMKQLTEELLHCFVAAGEGEEMGEVSINAVLEESLAGFYGAFTKRGIVPEIVLCSKPVNRRLNRQALSRIFDNILNNALKYSDGDLRVSLSEGGEICFSNRASSMTPVQAGKLFDRFFTVESGRDSTGLGLSIAKLLTEQCGGRIGAVYQEGRLTLTLCFSQPAGMYKTSCPDR